MGCGKIVVIAAFLALFTLMEQAKPVAAGNKRKALKKRVGELENRLAAIEKCIRILQCEQPTEQPQPEKARGFLFPNQKTTDYVDGGLLTTTLDAMTACLWLNTSGTNSAGYISYATRQDDNAFVLFNYRENTLQIIVGSFKSSSTGVTITDGQWHHVCVSWGDGAVRLYVDGALRWDRSASGLSLNAGAKLILGQDQDSFGGGFTAEQSFIGEMTGINFWDRVLSAAEISRLAESCEGGFKGNLLNMSSLTASSIRGDVQLKDLACQPSQ